MFDTDQLITDVEDNLVRAKDTPAMTVAERLALAQVQATLALVRATREQTRQIRGRG